MIHKDKIARSFFNANSHKHACRFYQKLEQCFGQEMAHNGTLAWKELPDPYDLKNHLEYQVP